MTSRYNPAGALQLRAADFPVSVLTAISVTQTAEGTAGFTLTLTGRNFVVSSYGMIDDSRRVSRVLSDTSIEMDLTDADLATAGDFDISVFTPEPGGGESNSLTLKVLPDTLILAIGETNGASMVVDQSPNVLTGFSLIETITDGNMTGGQSIMFATNESKWTALSRNAAGGGSVSRKYSSDDGDTWTATTPSATVELQMLAYSAALDKMVAAGGQSFFGVEHSSDGGVNWTTSTTDDNFSTFQKCGFDCLVYAEGGSFPSGLFVAVMNTGSRCFKSTNGTSWARKAMNVTTISSPKFSPIADIFVGLFNNLIYSSPDCETWTSRATLTTNNSNDNGGAICYDPVQERFVAVGNEGTLISTDGINWTTLTSSKPTQRGFLFASRRGIIYATRHLLNSSLQSNRNYSKSTDGGATWTAVTNGFSTAQKWSSMSERVLS